MIKKLVISGIDILAIDAKSETLTRVVCESGKVFLREDYPGLVVLETEFPFPAFSPGEYVYISGGGVQQRDLTPARLADIDNRRIAALWQAAHDLEFASISGSAIGLITMGVMSGKPKAIAVQAWIKDIWSLYYERKAGTSSDCDYSSVGACPHSVPELMLELDA